MNFLFTNFLKLASLLLPSPIFLPIIHAVLKARAALTPFPIRDVLGEAERLDCKEKGVISLAGLLLDDDNIVARIDAHKKLIKLFTNENPKAQKYFLYGLEPVLDSRPALLPKTAKLLHKLYETDLVEEEVFIAWFEKV